MLAKGTDTDPGCANCSCRSSAANAMVVMHCATSTRASQTFGSITSNSFRPEEDDFASFVGGFDDVGELPSGEGGLPLAVGETDSVPRARRTALME